MFEQIERCFGLVLVIIGASFTTVARLQLGSSWSAAPQARQLVITGFYAKLRNPMYVFNFCMFTGVALVLQWKYFWLFLLALAIVQFFRARAEAKVLLQKFGTSYVEYRSKTWF